MIYSAGRRDWNADDIHRWNIKMEYKHIPLAESYISFQEIPYHNRLFITDTVTTEAIEPVEHAIEQSGASFHVGKCISVTLQF